MSQIALQTESGAWIAIGALDDFPLLGARVVRAPGGDISVFRTRGDVFYALDNRCPHRGGPLAEGIVSGTVVTCPLHNWRIRLDSGTAVEPDEGCVHTHPVELRDGAVFLYLSGN